MTRTPTLPLDDRRMWRKAIAALHPDRGGDHESCVWIQAVRDAVCEGHIETGLVTGAGPQTRGRRTASADDPDRVPFSARYSFDDLTALAIERAGIVGGLYGHLLVLLDDCYSRSDMWREESRGASYKRLAAIGHAAGMDVRRRSGWYRLAESIPLSDRHAGHILSRLKRQAG